MTRKNQSVRGRWIRLAFAMLVFTTAGVYSATGSGVTVITHGWKSTLDLSGFPSWVDDMAQAVTNTAFQRGLNSSWYHIRIHGDILFGFTATMSRVSSASAADTAEVVVTVDWSDISDNTDLLEGAAIRTDFVAEWIAGGLLATYPNLGLNEPLSARSIHLIGHSRGASAMLETARLLGAYGIWVDHMTTLDPHPLAGILPGSGDPVAALYENIVFADNYWRQDAIPNPADFNGQPILGSIEVNLSESILSGVGHLSEHSDVHSWYHGTIGFGGTFPASDGDVSLTDEWYALPHPARNQSGFFYSRIANGSFLYRPAFSYAIGTKFGGRHVREITSRDGGSQWANIGQIQILPAHPDNKYPQGQPITASFKYQDRDSGVRVEWFIDSDTNPFNNTGSAMVVQTFDSTGDKVASSSVAIPTDGVSLSPPRRLLAKVTSLNNNAVRYEYADDTFTITWPDFLLNSVTPAQVLAGAGITHLILHGSGFTIADKIAFNNGTTITEVTPISVTGNDIAVDFNFGSTPRNWNVFVREYSGEFPFRDSASHLVQVVAALAGGPTITQQPGDATTIFGQTATFSVGATGSGTLTYQWQRNGVVIVGATTASYTTSPVSFAHDGYTYLVRVTDANGTTSTRLATLNVVAAAAPCNDPSEPNNSSLTPTRLALGATTNGLICSAADVDWFKVTLATSGQLNLALGISGGRDYDLELYGPDFAWMAGSYHSAGQNESIQRTVAAGDYFVRVYGYQGAYSPSQFYQLSANAAEIQPPGPTSGLITSAVVWSGVVEPTGDVTIMTGGSLKIMPGTQVRCAGGDDRASGADNSRVEIILNGGTLDASGAPDALIRFTSRAQNPIPGNWYGLRVIEGSVTMSDCVVEYAVDGLRFEDSDTRFNNYALGNVTVQRCSGSGVWTTSGQFASVTLNNFQLWTNGTGLSANGPVTLVGGQAVGNSGYGFSGNNATLVATGTTFSRNGAFGVYNYRGGGATLTGCVVTNNQSYGVYVQENPLNMAGCTVLNNIGEGIYANQSSLTMSGCTVSRNNGWGVNQSQGGSAEVWNSVVQSNGSGGLVFGSGVTVGVVSNTISGNSGTGLQLTSFGVSASGIAGNVITGNGGVGIVLSGSGPSPTTISGNDIYQNTNFELRNERSGSITANDNFWGEPTTTEWTAGQVNLSRIFDVQDNPSSGQVLILTIRGTPALQAPRFTIQPQSVSALPGESVALSASASGSDPITYQWYRNGSPVSQATNTDLALANLDASKAGNYFAVVANAAGRATSAVAQVTLIVPPAPPVIVQHPVSQTVALGGSVSFAVAATGTGPFTYQWKKNGAPIPGATAATLSITSVLVSDAAEYTVTVTNPGGNATSQPATLTLNTSGGTAVTRQITRSGTNFFVTVTVIPPVGTPVYLVEEFIPTGFTARDISTLGSLDAPNGRVVWGLFWDGLTRTLTYTLVAPAGFTGTATLNGAALFFGATAATAGDSTVSLLPSGQPAHLTLTRVSGIFAVSVVGEVGRSYRLEATDDLGSSQWEPLATLTLTQSPRIYVDADSFGKTRRFYRCVLIE